MFVLCKDVISKMTRKRAFVVSVALILPMLSLLWELDGSNSRYLDIATTSLRASIGSSASGAYGGYASSRSYPVKRSDSQNPRKQELPQLETVSGAVEFVMSRRQAYQEYKGAGVSIANQWKLRGHGYLYKYQSIVLAAESPQQPTRKGRNLVKIWNVHRRTARNFQDCHLLTLWVRVSGPEIFAGSPSVVEVSKDQACHWEFEFDIQNEGIYEVDAKMLLWNGLAPVKMTDVRQSSNGKSTGQSNQCPDTKMDRDAPSDVVEASHHNGFIGFKFYSPLSACCEICRRVEGCNHWTTPPNGLEPSLARNGCELYYNKTLVPSEEIPTSRMLAEAGIHQEQHRRRLNDHLLASGSPISANTEVAQFLGCGWSFHFSLDFPCLSGDLDDHIFMINRTFVVEHQMLELGEVQAQPDVVQESLPLCQLNHEVFRDDDLPSGRWVREHWPSQKMCPYPRQVDQSFKGMFEITAFDGAHPHCWHRDDLSLARQKCAEANCRLIPVDSKWESSSLHQEAEWMGSWRSYECEYNEFTNDQLQQCITERKISSISTSGVSIAAMMNQYLQVRTASLNFTQPAPGYSHDGLRSVVIDSLRWPHLLWHQGEDEWEDTLRGLPDVNITKEEHYWVTSFFVASEREPYVHVARAEKLAHLAQTILTPKGYKMINAYDLSAAFAFDTAGQGDGLHIIGPPMKAIFTKIFHHMCSGFVGGKVYPIREKQPDEPEVPKLEQKLADPQVEPTQLLKASPTANPQTNPAEIGSQLEVPKQQKAWTPQKKPVLPQKKTMKDAVRFVLDRKLAYQHHEAELPIANQWKLRGHGYLYTYHDIVLAAEGPGKSVKLGQNNVKIWNVHEKTQLSFQNCHLLTMWVRVSGPEIFAGSPTVVSAVPGHSCHWEFSFDVQKQGSYDIDIKILLWNGMAPVHFYRSPVGKLPDGKEITEGSQCPNVQMNQVPPGDGLGHHNGFIGFKFYSPITACCEICRRTEGCIQWSTPPRDFEASRVRNGCELYYNTSLVESNDIPRSHMLAEARVSQTQRRLHKNVLDALGTPESNNTETSYFLGCGWSYHFTLDFPCLSGDLDDQVYLVNPSFEATGVTQKGKHKLPLCQASHEALFRNDGRPSGRWMIQNASDTSVCPFPRQRVFQITAHNGDFPHCWHRDDLSDVRNNCGEPNCKLITTASKWEASKLHQQTDWMGVWRNYDCNYLEFTNNQLQTCLTKRRISSIQTKGASISGMMKKYLNVRLANTTLDKSGTIEVVVDTLKWPHLLWHESEDDWIENLSHFPSVDPSKKEHYWVSGFFVTSEREPYVQVERARRLIEVMDSILTPKGYKMINAFEPSAAFSHDTAAQGDGLHILGPPMKSILTKVFHHMCSDVVDGSIS
ncbi:NB-ARC domain [Seminavis robusta]|uniref:NB-ARC domain n=1 Tax=Seminavis robusta TaxID=568900 RepID=A0A9N8HKK0_9STRA|nr:NB-ARC domain [Seminavis robusta]|eukprot:Sro846_g210120.1 NB-ARC domain (1371) ;mRNA; f:7822-11934